MSDEIQAPRSEIKKLPRAVCVLCRLEAAKPIVDPDTGHCRNERACQLRRERRAADLIKRKGGN